MQKTAQSKRQTGRGILNKLREMTNVSGIAAEKFFNPEFQKVMESLREKDNTIRSLVTGQSIEGADPGADPVSLKDLLKSAKSNFNRREYMTAVAELGRFHKKLFDVTEAIKNLSLDVDAVHHEFLFKDLGPEHKQRLAELKKRFAQERHAALIKEASIMDFFMNIGTKRGRALAAWEKRYPKQVGKLKKDTALLLSRSEAVLGQVISALKEMASARATRNIDNYMKSADKITKVYQGYDKGFKDYYTSNIKNFLEKVELVPSEKAPPEAKELGKQEITPPQEDGGTPSVEESNIPIPLVQQQPITRPEPPPMMGAPAPYAPTALAPAPQTPVIPAPPGVPAISQPPTEPEAPAVPSLPAPGQPGQAEEGWKSDQLAREMWGKKSHQQFFASLESMAGESPILLASYIKKYAKSIETADPETAIQLFKIVKAIRS